MEMLKVLLREQGWTLLLRKRHNQEYIYAERMMSQPRRKVEKYIAPVSQLQGLTEHKILTQLAKKKRKPLDKK